MISSDMTILTPFDWLSQIVGTICQGPPPSYLLSPLPHLTLFPLFLLSLTLQQHAEGVVFGHYGGRGPRPRPHARGGVVGRPQRALGEGSPPAGTSLSVATCVGAGRGGGRSSAPRETMRPHWEPSQPWRWLGMCGAKCRCIGLGLRDGMKEWILRPMEVKAFYSPPWAWVEIISPQVRERRVVFHRRQRPLR